MTKDQRPKTNDQRFNIIVAMDSKRGIGKGGQLPWRLSADLKYFRELTTKTEDKYKKNVVVMGRKTWESLPEKFRPLPGRINVVLTRQKDYPLPEGVYKTSKFETVLLNLNKQGLREDIESVFFIGGAEIFRQVLLCQPPLVRKLYVTHVNGEFHCDTFFPEFENDFKWVSSSPVLKENSSEFFFAKYACLRQAGQER